MGPLDRPLLASSAIFFGFISFWALTVSPLQNTLSSPPLLRPILSEGAGVKGWRRSGKRRKRREKLLEGDEDDDEEGSDGENVEGGEDGDGEEDNEDEGEEGSLRQRHLIHRLRDFLPPDVRFRHRLLPSCLTCIFCRRQLEAGGDRVSTFSCPAFEEYLVRFRPVASFTPPHYVGKSRLRWVSSCWLAKCFASL